MNRRIPALSILPVLLACLWVTPALAGKDDDLKRTTVIIKYADGVALQRLLHPYLTHEGRVHFESRTRAMTLVDKPEVVNIMLKMIQQFDVKPPQIQFNLKLVLAENNAKPAPIPPEIKSIAKQLREVFAYNSFTVMDKAFITTEANQESSIKVGGDKGYTVDMATELIQGVKSTLRLKFHLYKHEWIKHVQKGPLGIKNTLVATTVEMKDGETAILGASKINGEGKALITIVTMKLK